MAGTIREYLIKDPDVTWKTAEKDLAPLGINESYFSNTKTKLRKDGVLPPRKKKGKKTATAKKPATVAAKPSAPVAAAPQAPVAKAAEASGDKMGSAVQFARSVGGLDEARGLIEKLNKCKFDRFVFLRKRSNLCIGPSQQIHEIVRL
ncbi:MAG: hypothetical protein R3C05_24105 [Pirellulaceae bacterium]